MSCYDSNYMSIDLTKYVEYMLFKCGPLVCVYVNNFFLTLITLFESKNKIKKPHHYICHCTDHNLMSFGVHKGKLGS